MFTLSLDEIAVTFFLIGRQNTLPLHIWGLLRRGITPEVNAASTIIFLVSVGGHRHLGEVAEEEAAREPSARGTSVALALLLAGPAPRRAGFHPDVDPRQVR